MAKKALRLTFERWRIGAVTEGCTGRKSALCLAFERQRGDGVWCQWRGGGPRWWY